MIGKDGVFGSGLALDGRVSLNHVAIQVAGQMSVINSDRFRMLADRLPELRKLTSNYENFLFAQTQQTAACNAVQAAAAPGRSYLAPADPTTDDARRSG